MIRIIADESVQSTLEGITETIELRDKHGELLGFFSPASPQTAKLYAEAAASIDPAAVKLRQRVAHVTYSTTEVLGRLTDAGRE
jgi:hypothetical protein